MALLKEHGYSIAEVREMDPWQTREIAFHKRDKDGNIELPKRTEAERLYEAFRASARRQGKSDREADMLWNQHLEAMADREVGHTNGQVDGD